MASIFKQRSKNQLAHHIGECTTATPQISISTNIVHLWGGSTITTYDTVSDTKESITLDKPINQYADSISIGTRIYFLGGNCPLSADVFEANLVSKKLIIKMPMLCKKFGHSLCSKNNSIYSIGGGNGAQSYTDCEVYNVASNSWEGLAELAEAKRYAAVVVH